MSLVTEAAQLLRDDDNVGDADVAAEAMVQVSAEAEVAEESDDSTDDAMTSSDSSGSGDDSAKGSGSAPQPEPPDVDDDVALDVAAQITASVERRVRSMPERANIHMVCRRSVRKTVHYGSMDDFEKLARSRALTEKYTQEHRDPFELWPRCRDCFPE